MFECIICLLIASSISFFISRLQDLRAQAAAMGLNSMTVGRGARPTRPARGTTHAFRGRGRGAANFAHVSLDHRPTHLLVSGYETEEKAEVLAHFQVLYINNLLIFSIDT